MEKVLKEIKDLCLKEKGTVPIRIEKLPRSGSNRIYFRVYVQDGSTLIATYNINEKENNTFITFSRHFLSLNLPVPRIFRTNEEKTIYLQEDLGTESLLNRLEQKGKTPEVFDLYKKSLSTLARIQILGDNGLDYQAWCLTAKEFGKQAILSDLLYFKYYFLDTLGLPYEKEILLDDFEALSTYLTRSGNKYFMFRDFQSRNIIVNGKDVHFIDYQGGMKGAIQYDVASLLWQARAQLSKEWKEKLLIAYMDEADKLLPEPLNRPIFESQYNGYVLIRLLQVLGAYGFRGLFERKAQFLSSIPQALTNLKYFLKSNQIGINTPELERILSIISRDDMIKKFTPPCANENTLLQITVNSFSYKKGIPIDETGNGGGFVFDMRGILNPGRFAEYKHLTGKDKPVQDFLEQRTRMNNFLNSIWDLIDITVEDYLKRNFSALQINFGCTGGQHRSVYAAEQTARHLRNKYHVKVLLHHLNEENWVLTRPEIS